MTGRTFVHRINQARATRRLGRTRPLPLLLLATLVVLPQTAAAQMPEEEEIAHPFFTHEGLPDAVGTYSGRLSGLATRTDGKTDGDFAFHLETGLTEKLGLHIRSDQFLTERRSEAMLQYALLTSADGESGFAPIVELEFPTRSGGGKARALVGFTTKLARGNFAFNQVIHYNLSEKSVEASAGLVLRASDRIYPVFEVLAEGGARMPTIVDLLAGVKYRLRGSTLLGVAYRRPVTSARESSSQFVVQLEFMVGKRGR